MLGTNQPNPPRENRLLAALSAAEYQRLIPNLEFVELALKQVLYKPSEQIAHVYFPHRAIVSLTYTLEDGSTSEVGMVGNEGMAGLPVILGGDNTTTTAIVQGADGGMRMRADQLKAEFNRGGELQSLLLRYTQGLLTQITQTAACNRHHSIEERLARWLLMVSDRTESNTFSLTQEFLSEMLGVRRAGVTVAAGTLNQAGIIRYNRGKIDILDRESLEATSCECYPVVKKELTRLLGIACG
ncbi:cAMP-binding proteins - catabolite gene activator and regulatory subunit of cAMP-dependent protein kinases [uncultured Synechococcales cyanobacterium]|uniref:cAMP-binding proteins - catabolite gene activator and regulatory subunit of cAMP-dependent protein kinases n=1 Tax=uncultured Synechococcales cyanobacterium TaxID=1936017 RepID=A0A6J4VCV4_9CYAN|nr:cAMP-binding proteins - catabolite gene activator and regulatory subunit of cAMP-dependent protein kinases [uncultured Synechococcales cyanobacterium]